MLAFVQFSDEGVSFRSDPARCRWLVYLPASKFFRCSELQPVFCCRKEITPPGGKFGDLFPDEVIIHALRPAGPL